MNTRSGPRSCSQFTSCHIRNNLSAQQQGIRHIRHAHSHGATAQSAIPEVHFGGVMHCQCHGGGVHQEGEPKQPRAKTFQTMWRPNLKIFKKKKDTADGDVNREAL